MEVLTSTQAVTEIAAALREIIALPEGQERQAKLEALGKTEAPLTILRCVGECEALDLTA